MMMTMMMMLMTRPCDYEVAKAGMLPSLIFPSIQPWSQIYNSTNIQLYKYINPTPKTPCLLVRLLVCPLVRPLVRPFLNNLFFLENVHSYKYTTVLIINAVLFPEVFMLHLSPCADLSDKYNI